MVHGAIPSAYKYNFWAERPGDAQEASVVELTCLMPNGVVIPFEINRNITLDQIKEVSILVYIQCTHLFYHCAVTFFSLSFECIFLYFNQLDCVMLQKHVLECKKCN